MKVTLYLDVSGYEPADWNFWATSKPTIPKGTSVTRYKMTVEVPDPADADVDLGEIPVEKEDA
jgi:hypothetical protein